MKKLGFLLLLAIMLSSCKQAPKQDYKYIWDIGVTYTNGDIDTLHHEMNSEGGHEVYLYIQTVKHVPGSIGNTTVPACLVSQCLYRTTTICCGVRKIDTLSFEKILIETLPQ